MDRELHLQCVLSSADILAYSVKFPDEDITFNLFNKAHLIEDNNSLHMQWRDFKKSVKGCKLFQANNVMVNLYLHLLFFLQIPKLFIN